MIGSGSPCYTRSLMSDDPAHNGKPQLMMCRECLSDLPEMHLPQGFSVRAFREEGGAARRDTRTRHLWAAATLVISLMRDRVAKRWAFRRRHVSVF